MKQFPFARGTTLPLTFVAMKNLGPGVPPLPFNCSTWHLVYTVRLILINGTVDSVSPPVFQADNALLGGLVIAPQPTTLPNGQSSLGVFYVVQPDTATASLPNPIGTPTPLYWDVIGNPNDGSGTQQLEFGRLLMGPRVGVSPA